MSNLPSHDRHAPRIVLDGLVIGYAQKPFSLPIHLHMDSGTFILRGSNGCGKSTLLRTIAGVIPPLAGQVTVAGYDLRRDHVQVLRRLAYAPDQLPLPPTALAGELLQIVRWAHGLSEDLGRSDLAERFGIVPYLGKSLQSLSLGQRRRLILVSALALKAPITLLDEPTVGLDHAGLQVLQDQLRERTMAGLLTVVVTHEAWADVLPDVHRLRWGCTSPDGLGGPRPDPESPGAEPSTEPEAGCLSTEVHQGTSARIPGRNHPAAIDPRDHRPPATQGI